MIMLRALGSLLASLLTRYGNLMLEMFGTPPVEDSRRSEQIPLEHQPAPWERP
ncbi:hypothetical protein [Novosphingobium naphthalenivorans]|uniref:hypothetical protein n=1 Tax=Novosphingobium naphthalenivorans TaxID=273168 RepID=UPI000A70890E|nr:hypothetical protein [Novosphingobium naphthalenivorans]